MIRSLGSLWTLLSRDTRPLGAPFLERKCSDPKDDRVLAYQSTIRKLSHLPNNRSRMNGETTTGSERLWEDFTLITIASAKPTGLLSII